MNPTTPHLTHPSSGGTPWLPRAPLQQCFCRKKVKLRGTWQIVCHEPHNSPPYSPLFWGWPWLLRHLSPHCDKKRFTWTSHFGSHYSKIKGNSKFLLFPATPHLRAIHSRLPRAPLATLIWQLGFLRDLIYIILKT